MALYARSSTGQKARVKSKPVNSNQVLRNVIEFNVFFVILFTLLHFMKKKQKIIHLQLTMPTFSCKTLKVIEKFRAPAGLWRPSLNAGDGWSETSGTRRGGRIIIQIQENADIDEDPVAVVRFELRHGVDVLNSRITKGLPIHRSDDKTVLFKSVSTSTGCIRRKTVHLVKFDSVEDTDDFLMWWYAKNGSIKAWLGDDSGKTGGTRKATTPIEKKPRGKRKATTPINDLCKPSEKKPKVDMNKGKRKKQKKCLVDSTNKKNNNVSESKEKLESKHEPLPHDGDKKEDVVVDLTEDPPQSQDWYVSFNQYEED